MNILITGASGFVGGFLASHCVEANCSVLGLDIKPPGQSLPGFDFELCDVRDASRLKHLISTFLPDTVFHLAAQSYPTVSLVQPLETMQINAGGTINLFESLHSIGMKPTVVVACSSAEYGPVEASDLPVKEEHALCPLHPYGVSKVAQDLLAQQYFLNYGIPSVRIRIFNTTGPGKMDDVCSDLTKRAVEIEKGLRPAKLPVGNVHTRRALLDVRDLVRGLWLSATHCQPGEVYNVGGRLTYSVQELIERVRSSSKRSFETIADPALIRACDELVIWGDTTRFSKATGWSPVFDMADTLQHMLEWWRNRMVEVLEAKYEHAQ